MADTIGYSQVCGMLNGAVDHKDAVAAIREFLLDAPMASNLKGLTNYVEKEGRF